MASEDVLERRRQALELRQAGVTLAEIAKTLKVSIQQVRKDISAALEAEEAEDAGDQIKVSLKALDHLFRISYQKALKGDVRAVELALKITDRRLAVLGQLAEKEPAKQQVVTPVDELRLRREQRAKRRA